MKFVIILSLFLGLSCSKQEVLGPAKSNEKNEKESEEESESYKSITLQHFTQGSNQIGFDIMPVTTDGTPIGCDDTSLKFQIKKYFNNELVEDSENVSIECKNNESVDVGLVLDNSGSVRDYRLMVENSVSNLLKDLFSFNSNVSLTEVNTNSKVLTPAINDLDDFKKALGQMSNKGGWTALYDGIRMGHDTLIEKVKLNNEINNACDYKRKAIIVMTDGEENNSCEQKYEEYSLKEFPGDKVDTTLEDILDLKIEDRKIPVFSLGVGTSIDQESLENISKLSGASYRSLASFEEVSSAFNDISNYLQSPYQVCLDTENKACGDYKIVVDFSSDNGPEGQKVLEFNIACNEEVITQEKTTEKTEEIINEEEIETVDGQKELELNYSKEVIYPLFNDENGRKELVSVNLHFESIKNLDLETLGTSNIERESSFHIEDHSGEIVKLEKTFNESKSFENNFSDKQVLSGIYKIPSSYFKYFVGEGKDEITFSARDFFKWNSQEKITGSLEIVGNFIIEYIWRYRQRSGVIIPDANLRLAVRNATGIRVGDITPESMERITQIDVRNKEISTFDGLEYAINLNKLIISNTSTRDISFLTGLVNLEYLDISTNTIEDFSVLNKMQNLKYLYLNSTNLSNANDISNMKSLKTLQMKNTDVLDIYPFKALMSLETLVFRNCRIKNYSYVKNLVSIKNIDFYGCKNSPDESLELSKEITYNQINLGNTNFSKLERLSGYEITNLNIAYNNLSSLDSILAIKNLKILHANNNSLSNIDFLMALKIETLKTLNLTSNLIDELKVNEVHEVLNTLYLQSNLLTGIEGLKMFPNLTRVNVSYNAIDSLSVLSSLKKLKIISALNTTSNGVESLKELTDLYYLDLTNTNLSSVRSIDFSSFPSLTSLIIRNVEFVSLSFLNKEAFSSFDIRYNEISCEQQKSIVDYQYMGRNISYTAVEDCPYVYTPGATTRLYTIKDNQELGVDFFGDFDTNNLLEPMNGAYSGSFEPIELNNSESLTGVSFTLLIKLNSTLTTDEKEVLVVNLLDNMTLSLNDGRAIFHESKFTLQRILESNSEDGFVEVVADFSETKKLSDIEIKTLQSASKINFQLNYTSTPWLDDKSDRQFSVDNNGLGHLEINYQVTQEL